MKTNTKVPKRAKAPLFADEKLAGGIGPLGAYQNAEQELRRLVMTCLLYERNAYSSGDDVANRIAVLVPKVAPKIVADIAIAARTEQGLRHVPLFIAREMARHTSHRGHVGALLERIVLRPDEASEFMAMYWKEGKVPVAKQVKLGLAAALSKFSAYQLAKYYRANDTVTLRDVLFMVHADPKVERNGKTAKRVNRANYKRGPVMRHDDAPLTQLASETLPLPDSLEVLLTTRPNEKREVFEELLQANKLGAVAFIRNLRLMTELGVRDKLILAGFSTISPKWILPLNYLAAAKHAPRWTQQLEAMMLKGFANTPKLPGHTVLIVDVSGSMDTLLSTTQAESHRDEFRRIDACAAMTMLAVEMCERSSLYITGGTRTEATTKFLPARRGFGVIDQIHAQRPEVGLGGIFTRRALEYTRSQERGEVDRIIVLSDSQDCERTANVIPRPYGKTNYIVDMSAERLGVNYGNVWTAEVSGWSAKFINYIMALEGVGVADDDSDV